MFTSCKFFKCQQTFFYLLQSEVSERICLWCMCVGTLICAIKRAMNSEKVTIIVAFIVMIQNRHCCGTISSFPTSNNGNSSKTIVYDMQNIQLVNMNCVGSWLFHFMFYDFWHRRKSHWPARIFVALGISSSLTLHRRAFPPLSLLFLFLFCWTRSNELLCFQFCTLYQRHFRAGEAIWPSTALIAISLRIDLFRKFVQDMSASWMVHGV